MNALRVLIVDDEAPARAELRYLLARIDGATHADEAETARDALTLLDESPYDAVFLDVRMPELSGLDAVPLVERRVHPPDVVFVTAYDEHALKAFELAAVDYLLKPVAEARLRRTLERLLARRSGAEAAPSIDKLPVEGEEESRTVFVRFADVRYVEARGHVTFAKTFDRTHRTRFTLADLERRLAPHGFVRVHRSYLVNLERIGELEPFFSGTQILRVDDRERTEIPVSRSAAPRLRAIFGL